VLVEGITFKNVGKDYIEDKAAITSFKSKGFIIRNNRFENTFFGIMCLKSHYGLIENNFIKGNAVNEYSSANAIHLWYCSKMLISNNKVHNHRDGIYLEFVSESIIKENISSNNLRYGLHFIFSDKDQYLGNTFEKNGAGVAVMFSNFITMTDNVFNVNWGSDSYGLLLKEIYDSDITRNTFSKNSIGIYAEGLNRANIVSNNFKSNGWAFKISGSSLDNRLTQNNFINNTFNMSTNSSYNENFMHQNY
jgi:nitrous oxidase accessory protein